MKTIKINVVDFGGAKENFITQLLKEKYEVVFSDEPDFLFYSVSGLEHTKYKNCVKIFYTAEPVTPNFEECDYAIGFDYIQFDDRYLRLPFFAMEITEDIQNRTPFQNTDLNDKKFCNFIYSNGTSGIGARLRTEFCKKLMEYKHVDCAGLVLNNMSSPKLSTRYSSDWYQSKIDFIGQYKFTIAFENTYSNGYTTEKLTQPLMAGSIPIYYGNKRVTDEFNPNSFINCNDYDNDFEAIIKKVEEIDNDDNMARKMICTPPMKEGYDFDWRTKLGGFLECIIEKGNTPYIIGKSYNDTSAQNVEYVSDFTLNNEIYANAIIEKVKKYKSVMIYGDGKYANNLGTVLKKINEVTIKCFIVTNKQEGKDKLMGIPIIEFDEKVIDKNDLIMIAIREEAQESLIKKLWNNGYKNLMAVNDYIIGIIEKNCCNVGEVV